MGFGVLLGGTGSSRLGRSGGTRDGCRTGASCGLGARVHRLCQGLRACGTLSRRRYRSLFRCRAASRCCRHSLCTTGAFLEHSGPLHSLSHLRLGANHLRRRGSLSAGQVVAGYAYLVQPCRRSFQLAVKCPELSGALP
ncbi:hypothetical protein [Streptomyces scabiei]|uniref:hypothetical protein n=1 Tax=Streptomyces scabiei TaxID=1930 RepID=UPI0038F73BC6